MLDIKASSHPQQAQILTPELLAFVQFLEEKFGDHRQELLRNREQRQYLIDKGQLPQFLPETKDIRSSSWQVAPCPEDLLDRRVEITGPADRKMIINALNSGAKVFMADLEDSLSPSWDNVLNGQLNLKRAVDRQIDFVDQSTGKEYKLLAKTATLVVRPRGWHLDEMNIHCHGKPISASLFDFACYFFHNAKNLLAKGSGPYFYLPKLENHAEARLWNNVFIEAQKYLHLPQGTIRATVLIETITAAFEMDEILYELKEHASGLNAGRWDYLFSLIKRFRNYQDLVLPDRSQLTMSVPFMRAYSQLLVKCCHRHGAHAIGGMSAFIPNRHKPEITERALANVRADKTQEANDGFDGSWVAHPDLVLHVKDVFDAKLGKAANQKHVLREDVVVHPEQLIGARVQGGKITEQGLRTNTSVAIQYIGEWLAGRGAVAINDLMEDAATAEISRAQIWQWLNHRASMDDGTLITPDLYRRIRQEELDKLPALDRYTKASEILDSLVLAQTFPDFLTLKAYPVLSQS